MLYKRGLIDISQHITRDGRWRSHLRVILNNNLRLHYDTFDGWEIDEEYLSEADFYFKRSYSSPHIKKYGENRKKIYPLGLNYPVYPDKFDKFALRRGFTLADNDRILFKITRSVNVFNRFLFTPRVHTMESLPDYDAIPKVLFMVRAWNPYDNPKLSKKEIEQRIYINEVRYNCIKLLRGEFGYNFYGGFIHTDFAEKNYKDFLIPNSALSSKREYVKLLKSHPICVATTGLHGSIGWKFAEYVAFSKAIVSEKLNYELPGDIANDRNYLEFSSSEDCVERVTHLFQDQELRNYLMTNNCRYYQSYLRPDTLILNTIMLAFSEYQN